MQTIMLIISKIRLTTCMLNVAVCETLCNIAQKEIHYIVIMVCVNVFNQFGLVIHQFAAPIKVASVGWSFFIIFASSLLIISVL